MEENLKQLLLKDLCGRLPYHPQIYVYVEDIGGSCEFNEPLWSIEIDTESYLVNDKHISEDIKPYLRPMSNMTEEESIEYNEICLFNGASIALMSNVISSYETIDWLNAHHFDYRGLIEKGLALEAPEDMYKIE